MCIAYRKSLPHQKVLSYQKKQNSMAVISKLFIFHSGLLKLHRGWLFKYGIDGESWEKNQLLPF